MAAVTERTGRRARVGNPATGNGGGGGNRGSDLNRYRRWGDGEKGAYEARHDKTASALGPSTDILDGLQRHTGVQNLFRPGLINSKIAGAADAYVKQVPQLVQNAKTYYTAIETSSAADLKVKEMRVKAAAKHSIDLTNQQLMDGKFIRQQMENVVTVAADEWETGEVYIQSQASLDQLAKTSLAL